MQATFWCRLAITSISITWATCSIASSPAAAMWLSYTYAYCSRSASGENELDADQLFGSIEQHLFSQALSMAEKRGQIDSACGGCV